LAANNEGCKVSVDRHGNTNADGIDFDNGCVLESDSMKRFFLLFVVFSSMLGCRPVPQPDTVAIRQLPDESIAITRTRFWKEYEVNPVRAEEMLKNKRVRITDKLSYIDQPKAANKTVTLGFVVGGPEIRKSHYDMENLDSLVDFVYPESFRSQIVPLNPGQTVTLEGVYKGVDIDRRTLSFVGISIVKD
jgi:hypothetical protein